MPGNRTVYNLAVAPELRRRVGREAKTCHEIAPLMERQPYWQMGSSLLRTCQEVMWDVYGEKIEKQLPALVETARRLRTSNRRKGSLRLNPALEVPRYHSATDIHIQPGGYHSETGAADDVYAGALYDDAIWTFRLHDGGPLNDQSAWNIIHYLKKTDPAFKPKRILDMAAR
ncbi:MAG: hypothetical protein EXQ85_03665 [Alphaproteobacteria bacterium]|nr:hypothetical protein [Alphaproteobacteria bacterium]